MKVLEDQRVIELTERNLTALLTKLQGKPKGSACTIMKEGWQVRAVRDEQHYSTDNPAGRMHPETEKYLGPTTFVNY